MILIMRVLVLITAVVAFVGGLAVTASAHSASTYRIPYARWGRTMQILTVSSAGGHLSQLTHESVMSDDPSVSRDGSKIVYDRGGDRSNTRDIWTMNADGSDKRRITFTPRIFEAKPSWSPDGSKIAYVTGTGLWVMNSDGSDRHRLSGRPSYGAPSWSADGTKIVFSDFNDLHSPGGGHL